MAATEIALDNDALSTLLGNANFSPREVARVVRERDLRIVLVSDVLAETCDGDLVHVARRLGNLAALARLLDDHRLALGALPRQLLSQERRGKPPGSALLVPRTRWAWFLALCANRDALAQQHADLRAASKERFDKDGAWARDIAAEAAASPDFRRESATVLADVPRAMATQFAGGGFPLNAFVQQSGAADPAQIITRLASDPKRARVHAAFFAMSWLNGLAVFVRHEARSAQAQAFKAQRGAWADAYIVAAASYCESLVTYDKVLRAKIDLARDAGLLRTRWATLADVGLDASAMAAA